MAISTLSLHLRPRPNQRFALNSRPTPKTPGMRYLYLLLILLLTTPVFAQDSGDNVLDRTVLHDVRFEYPLGDLYQELQNNFRPFDPFDPGPYTMANVIIDGERVDSVGVRLKGFTSYQGEALKNPFKIDFNRFVKGKRLDGLRKINLNNATADPGMQRDVLCYQMLNDIGVPSPRTAFAKVYINGMYWGLYQMIEQVDKEFLQRNYNFDDGNLFKNKDWNNFEYLGEDPNNYNRIYQLKTNEEEDDWTGLIRLMRVIRDTPPENFAEEIGKIFNVDRYLRTLAVDVATNNWDSNLQHGRNWYMYEDTQTGIFHWIPWDYNLALGGDLFGGGGGDDCFVGADFLFATDSTTTVQFVDAAFYDSDTLFYNWTFGDGNSSTEREPVHVFDSLGQYEVCLTVDGGAPFCSDTRCYFVDLTNNVYNCPTIASGQLPTDDLGVFLRMLQWSPECCSVWDANCQELLGDLQEWFGDDNDDGGNGDGDGGGFAIDQRGTDRILIQRLLDVPAFYDQYRRHFCNLVLQNMSTDRYATLVSENRELIIDHVEDDANFLYDFDDFLEETGSNGMGALLRSRANFLTNELEESGGCPTPEAIPTGDIVINEFLAVNDSLGTTRDSAGETDDWVELYNNTDAEIDLSDVYLSDNPENKFKWQFPAGTILPAAGYLIVWCDEDGGQAGLHASFKLNRDGEQIFLSNADGSSIDEVVFGEQENNVSVSRVPNGTGNFVAQHTTFKFSNDTPVSTPDLGQDVAVRIFPNPVADQLTVGISGRAGQRYTLDVISSLGQVLQRGIPASQGYLQVTDFAPGLYLLTVRDSEGRSRTLRFVKE